MSYPPGQGQGPGNNDWRPYSEPTQVGQPQFGPSQYGQQPPQDNGQGGQFYGQHDPNYNPYQPYPASGGQWGPPQPRKSRTPLIIGLVAVAVLVVVAVVVALIVALGGGGASSDPDSAVEGYLTALSDGDAAKALDLSKSPASELLLTDDILKQQQEIAKISDISIVDVQKMGEMATVQATYQFGDRKADESFVLHKTGDSWRLDEGVVAVDISSLGGIPGLTAFGVPVDGEAKVYVFPGPVKWGSADENFAVVNGKEKDFPVAGTSYGSFPDLTAELSGKGQNAVNTAVQAHLDECALSVQVDAATDKPDCGQRTYAYNAEPGSAKWTAPAQLPALDYRLGYDNPEEVSVDGEMEWSVTFRTTASGSRPAETKTETVTDYLYGTVDLAQNPPVFTPEG